MRVIQMLNLTQTKVQDDGLEPTNSWARNKHYEGGQQGVALQFYTFESRFFSILQLSEYPFSILQRFSLFSWDFPFYSLKMTILHFTVIFDSILHFTVNFWLFFPFLQLQKYVVSTLHACNIVHHTPQCWHTNYCTLSLVHRYQSKMSPNAG